MLRLAGAAEEAVPTPYGPCQAMTGRLAGCDVVFVSRHGRGHTLPPHRINYRANVWGLREIGVQAVIATAAVGSLNPKMQPGDCVIVAQFLDFTKGRPLTFFDENVRHTDVTDPYCPALSELLAAGVERALAGTGAGVHRGGCYVCTEGPRYETRAEIRAFQRLGGDLVGMTGVPEVVLARELGLCYATLAIVTNWAAGVSERALHHAEVAAAMAARLAQLEAALEAVLPQASERAGRKCSCSSSC